MRTLILALVLVILAPPAEAVGWPFRCVGCERDSHGKIKRSSSSLRQFRITTGYPKGRKGYVIDHKLPLACATSRVEYQSLDTPANMQWQTRKEGKAKDRWEMHLCDPETRDEIAAMHGQAFAP